MGSQGYFARVSEMTATRLWINNVTPGEAQLAINAGAVGCTQNPTYPQKMLTHPIGSDHAYTLLDGILKSEPDDTKAQSKLQYALVKEVAEVFLPLYTRSHGTQGFVTIQGDPFHEDLDTILEAARYHTRECPNIMPRFPQSPQGLPLWNRFCGRDIRCWPRKSCQRPR
ncbi:hypothetical protein AGMMS4952_19450 [Spirochaetia bacterium]|nr:hypothetical protein AGMMS4952_19450 [Spirochaetia bacterium]